MEINGKIVWVRWIVLIYMCVRFWSCSFFCFFLLFPLKPTPWIQECCTTCVHGIALPPFDETKPFLLYKLARVWYPFFFVKNTSRSGGGNTKDAKHFVFDKLLHVRGATHTELSNCIYGQGFFLAFLSLREARTPCSSMYDRTIWEEKHRWKKVDKNSLDNLLVQLCRILESIMHK